MENGTLISGERLLSDLKVLAGFGALPAGQGIDRPAFSPAYRQALAWLRARMADAGMTVRMDAAGNLIGRLGPEHGSAIVCGSHVDTVPGGGALDGALGVMAGIEIARQIHARSPDLKTAFEIVAFADEEGAFISLLGSRAMTGQLEADEVADSTGRDGETLSAAMRDFGLAPEDIRDASRPSQDIAAFLELHIEQGPVLEAEGLEIGVVDSIVGLLSGTLLFHGQANHAGTTPLALRRDAMRAAAETVTKGFAAVETEFGEDVRLTFGAFKLSPDASNVVPGRAVLTFEIRAGTDVIIDSVLARLMAIAQDCARRARVHVERSIAGRDAAAAMSPDLTARILTAAGRLGYRARRMPSGAGHDAQALASFCPTAMVFVPSIGGISHNPAEDTADQDLVRGATLLCRVVMDLLELG
ncbi:Zn-dependent hydrolase [Oricola sp.]|uniref:Zn-dependent hydrolase n=1 Tax=Oricola sp. TaxID=1979950 RepID=UPI0025D3ADB8|nr:Zn-dependent hydrolase [Oricola sp.]MCI5076908.1 Zn-dependent hydrolase [Oricola sp.]